MTEVIHRAEKRKRVWRRVAKRVVSIGMLTSVALCVTALILSIIVGTVWEIRSGDWASVALTVTIIIIWAGISPFTRLARRWLKESIEVEG